VTRVPYGSWKSPITSNLIVSETIGLSQTALDGDDVYWAEMRPAEGGRYVVVKRSPDGTTVDVTPPTFNARTRVHEYGGGSFWVAGGDVYFSNFADQRLYRQAAGSKPKPITAEEKIRFADGIIDRERGRIVCVREDHTDAEREPTNTLVSVRAHGNDGGDVLVSGADFYASPRLSPDGSRLAWLSWNHPNMPWDGTELWVGKIDENGSLVHLERLAGSAEESIFQPEWSPDGVLYFVSDRTGWWNLYRWENGKIDPVCEMEAEFGLPQWVFGMSTYAVESAGRIVCAYAQGGIWHLASINMATGRCEEITTPYTSIGSVQAVSERVVFVAASPTEPTSVVQLDLATGDLDVLRRSSAMTIDADYLSEPLAIEFPTEHGMKAHAFFYPPKNPDFVGPEEERPPLVVMSHGGPTASTSGTLNPVIQHWTSRGIAVLDVNYGGSTGYGRAYRQRLDGQWGVVDVDDCVNGARFLVEQGAVDGDRLAIRGGSAGGYTTLCALTFRDVFKAGASYYGVSDLEALVKDTHKFESRYLDRLTGPYPESRDIYLERAPIQFVDRLSCPVIFFQGLEDRIVPPNQAEMMVDALRAKGVPVAYVPFEGEQHGFRRAETIKRALDGELYFYSKVFGFTLADSVEPVKIENL
jgi:dipeptidyl aminopeptidase/acylaminoacyl peptidase